MNYGKRGLKMQIRAASSKSMKNKTKAAVIGVKLLLAALLCLAGVVCACGIGMFRGMLNAAPDINSLDMSPSASATVIYDADGNEIQTLVMAGSNREIVSYSEIPQNLINAFIAIEDKRFWEHNGVDIKGTARAFLSGFKQGGSTITQQLLKNVAFGGGAEASMGAKIERKVQEQYLAIELEKNMDKKQILENYLNTINLGANSLGVQTAAERYFNKSVSDLTLSECAVIASIPKSPTKYNPIINPEYNEKRRALVLDNMFEQGMISEDELNEALADNVYERIADVDATRTTDSSIYSYFVDETIVQALDDLEKSGYSETEARRLLYSGGLRVYTTQDPSLQKIVDEEISNPDNYSGDVSYGLSYRLSVTHEDGTTVHYNEAHVRSWIQAQGVEISKMIFDSEEEILGYVEGFKKSVVKQGDSIAGERTDITLQPQASCVLMEQETGYVRAISGGRGKKTASMSLNRATDSLRQPGSTFKVLTAFAPALDSSGATLGSVYYDSPYSIGEKTFSNWWGNEHVGYANIRDGMIYSMNIIALKTLMNTVTPQVGYQYALDFGITSLVDSKVDESTGRVYSDIQAPLCLGGITYGVSNLELTAAYASIANQGVYNEPVYYTKITDSNGKVILDRTPESHTVLKETTAWLLTDAMQDVCESSHLYGNGSIPSSPGSAVKVPNMPTAGKSGTTTENNDIWFVGYTPYYTMGLWQGYDENLYITTGKDVRNMWNKMMTRVHEELPEKEFPAMPSGIEAVSICHKSGKLAIPGVCDCDPGGNMVYTEYFAKGTSPTETCDHHTKATLCRLTGALATEFCPVECRYDQVYRVITDDYTGYTDDMAYTMPANLGDTVCQFHLMPLYPFLETQYDQNGHVIISTNPETGEPETVPPPTEAAPPEESGAVAPENEQQRQTDQPPAAQPSSP